MKRILNVRLIINDYNKTYQAAKAWEKENGYNYDKEPESLIRDFLLTIPEGSVHVSLDKTEFED